MPFYREARPGEFVDPTEDFPFVSEAQWEEDHEAVFALAADHAAMRTDVAIVVRTIDAIMPAIEKAIAAEWKRENYINGPQFGAALERLRASCAEAEATADEDDALGMAWLAAGFAPASADTHPKDGDVKQAPLVSGAVPKADAQKASG